MVEEAYKEGSECPAVNPKILRVYSMRFCPYAERIRLVINHLNIKHEIININTNSKPEWFLELNPDGSVPVIQFRALLISQSLVCIEFLNDEFVKSKLLARKPLDRALQKMVMEKFDKVATPFGNIVKTTDSVIHQEEIKKIHSGLEVCEKQLLGLYFGGKIPCLVDFAIWPWFERFPAASLLTGLEFLSASDFPKLTKWVDAMKKLDAVKKLALPDELHATYLQHKQNGSTDIQMVNLGLADIAEI